MKKYLNLGLYFSLTLAFIAVFFSVNPSSIAAEINQSNGASPSDKSITHSNNEPQGDTRQSDLEILINKSVQESVDRAFNKTTFWLNFLLATQATLSGILAIFSIAAAYFLYVIRNSVKQELTKNIDFYYANILLPKQLQELIPKVPEEDIPENIKIKVKSKKNEVNKLLEYSQDKNLLTTQDYLTLSYVFSFSKDYEKAEDLVNKCLGIDSDNSENLIFLGRLLYYHGKFLKTQNNQFCKIKFGEALKPLHKALEIDPSSCKAWNNLGLIFGELGEANKEEICYDTAVKINPKHGFSNYNKACNYSLKEDFDKAYECLVKALESERDRLSSSASSDEDLKNLREHPIYKKKVEDLIENKTMRNVLKELF
ncbi:MAG TPA: hypothetical protein DCF68_05045 [Cyanothece sp. UBA12306]|nr:hypothetical protein [Cyanothece sp. UBA12306]